MTQKLQTKEAQRAIIRATLKNDVCSAQCLDTSADRARVARELFKALGL